MATVRFIPRARPRAQITTAQVTAYDAATTYSLTVNGKSVTTIAAGSVNATATALATAWNAATDREFAEITASAATDTVTLTGDTKGLPFTVTSAESGGTGTIGDPSTTTAATGPNHWDDANNWSGAAVPSSSDIVHLDHPDTDIRYGLAQSAVTLAELHTYDALIGLPQQNTSGYSEYRATYLAISATSLVIGEGNGRGTQRCKINLGTAQTTARILNSSTPAEQTYPAIMLKGTHPSNAVYATRGDVGFAVLGGEVATIATLEVGYSVSRSSDVSFLGGLGLTLTTLQQIGGRVVLNAGLTTVDKRDGTLEINAGSVTTLSNYGGSVIYRGTGTIGTLNSDNAATTDFGQDTRACTVTDATLRNCTINDPLGRVVWTNAISSPGETSTVRLNVGRNRTVAIV